MLCNPAFSMCMEAISPKSVEPSMKVMFSNRLSDFLVRWMLSAFIHNVVSRDTHFAHTRTCYTADDGIGAAYLIQ